ncbi:ROK family transcriptional regulator [Neobacillus sp. MM2021_6]|uniref:ROK family transcriptional regulator n=1 Tax=Bacillaceae TaxID=186817 RepID=UPI00140BEFF3|nr:MULTISPECIES: ROK family transcriptional regulator [Bacillaceae]MBO0959595.1 ROK family transcriptional regulator [Neobacillus sp. MM2021_6]NHC20169.1 ROK family protein [Bacillus sp. MM2020_4]
MQNKKRILQCILEHAPISRAEIAGKMKISKPTVSLLVDELIQEKWIFEKGIGESTSQGGRRPIHLYFNEKAAYIIGTDIGGTKVKIVISDLNGNIVASSSFQTEQYLNTGLLKKMAKEISVMIQRNDIDSQKILGMGVGVPGITEATGIVVEAPSLNWIRYPFIKEAERHFSFPIYVDNDVNVAALGEQWLGNAKQKENVLFIAIGTGIGSGIIIHNQLYRGSANAAGEMGYMVTDKNNMKNEFQPIFHRYGYLESIAGGKAMGDKLTKLVQQDPNHSLYEQAKSERLTGEMAFTLAKKGDEIALKVVEGAIEHIAYGIINAASLLNPEVIILGGGVLKSSEFIIPKLRKIVDHYLPSSVQLKTSQLGDNAGVLGAVSLFLREHESIINFS